MLRKPQRTTPATETPPPDGPSMDANDQELPPPSTINPEQQAASQKNIQALLDQMNLENFEEMGVAIDPIEPPALIHKRDPIEPIVPPQATQLSSYRAAYVPTGLSWTPPQPSRASPSPAGGVGAGNDRLLEKMNYIIHLLEQQEKEKTDNVMEEFILYCFLGVFVIYVVDSFSRSGGGGGGGPRYTR